MVRSVAPRGIIRRAAPSDLPCLGDIAAQVFAIYGSDYGLMIPSYARDLRVITLVYDLDSLPAGFLQVGFLEPPGSRRGLVADILAVAVVPGCRGHGLGTALFERAMELLTPMLERGTVSGVQLTVADTNHRASQLFHRLGFRIIDDDYGTYEGGQRALRMAITPSRNTPDPSMTGSGQGAPGKLP